MRDRRLTVVLLLVAGMALAIAGAATWRMALFPAAQPVVVHASHPAALACPADASCLTATAVVHTGLAGPGPRPYRLHPLRAELLWVASAACAICAVALAGRRRPASRHGIPV
jgi:ABC-type Fe3+-siderophore transport system permease subunit